jgi:hypothetical protein
MDGWMDGWMDVARERRWVWTDGRANERWMTTAQRVYVNKEIFLGLGLGLVCGAVWKWNHWQHRSAQQEYYAALQGKKK